MHSLANSRNVLVNWLHMSSTPSNWQRRVIQSTISSFSIMFCYQLYLLLNLANIISKPTRIAAHSNTVFDPIIISDTMNYIYSVVLKYHQKLLITMPLWLFYNVQRVFLFHSNGKSGYMIKLITKHYWKTRNSWLDLIVSSIHCPSIQVYKCYTTGRFDL
jgi:hypothetical protein